MAKTMSPSNTETITAGQIGKIQEVLGAALRKSGLLSEPLQQVIEPQGAAIAKEFVDALRKRVDAVSDMIVRHVHVDRTRTPQQLLEATGRRQYTDTKAVTSMPMAGNDEEVVYFFKVGRFVNDEVLEQEYALRGLIPADPNSQGQVNIDDPTFADEHPNGTHWKDANGKWCFATFDRWVGERFVFVRRFNYVWFDDWWFAGFRK